MTFTRPRTPVLVAALALLSSFLPAAAATAPTALAPMAAAEAPGGALTPVTPFRLMDTRKGVGGSDRLAAGETVRLQVTGHGGVPTSGVAAAVLNVTVVSPTSGGHATVYPSGAERPLASNVNFTAGKVVPNLVVATLGSDGAVSIYVSQSAADLVVDVSGWFSDAATTTGTGGLLKPLTPDRLLDTRRSFGGVALASGQSLELQVAGRGGVPAAGASAVVLNTTVVSPTAGGYLTVWPSGGSRPLSSNLNFVKGQTVPNRVIVGLGSGGKVSIFNGGPGKSQVVVDVSGWFTSDGASTSGAGYYQALTPARALDTRNGARRVNDTPMSVQLTGVAGVPETDVVAVVANTTVTRPARAGHLTVYPGGTRPLSSDLNFVAGQTVANLAVTKVDPSGAVSLVGSGGDLDVILDVAGYFTSGGAADPTDPTPTEPTPTDPGGESPAISTTTLPAGKVNEQYATTLSATGGEPPYTWEVAAGALPDGLFLDSNGDLSGRPYEAGSFVFTVQVTDSAGATAKQDLTLRVVEFAITSTSPLPTATVSAPYRHVFTTAEGTDPVRFSSGPLPEGFTLSEDGVLTGTASGPFTQTFEVYASDAAGNSTSKTFTLSAVASADPLITTAGLPGGQLGAPYKATLDAAGGTGPYSYAVTAGSLPAGITLSPQGALTGTPAALGTSTATITVTDAGGRSSSRQFTIPVTALHDWTQPRRDPGGRSAAPGDTTLTAENVEGLRVENTIPLITGQPAVVEGVVYSVGSVPGDEALRQLGAYSLGSAELLWSVPVPCGGAAVSVTAEAVVFPCDGKMRAYSRTGSHALLWSTDAVDPGAGIFEYVVLSDRVVAVDSTALYVYRLSDGTRLWRQLAPSGQSFQSVAADESTVVATLTDRAQSYSATTGALGWTVSGTNSNVVIDSAAVYLVLDGSLHRRALSTGELVWQAPADTSLRNVLAADGTHVLATWEQCSFESGCHTTMRSFDAATGAQQSEAETGTRPVSAAIVGDLAWVTRADTGGANGSDSGGVRAYRLSTGELVRDLEQGRRLFTPAVVAEGRVLVARAEGLKVFGFGSPPPSMVTRVLRSGHVGSAYADRLTASGGAGGYTWSIASGTLPAGLSLDPSTGAITGTPTSAASAPVVFRVTDARGMSSTYPLVVQISTPTSNVWPTASMDMARTGTALGETVVGLDRVAQMSEVWTGTRGAETADVAGEIAVTDRMAYVPYRDTGQVIGYPLGAGTGERQPTYRATVDVLEGTTTPGYVWGGVTVVGNQLLVVGQDGLYSFDATTGEKQWKGAFQVVNYIYGAPLVVGDLAVAADADGVVRAFDMATGTPAWTWTPEVRVAFGGSLATDGTRIFGVARCELFAIDAATGVLAWNSVLSATGEAFCSAFPATTTPLVSDGVVYTASYGGAVASDAATGATRWRRDYTAGGSLVLSQGVLVLTEFVPNSSGYTPQLRGVSASDGSSLWTNTTSTAGGQLSLAGDLVLAHAYDSVSGFDLRNGDKAWFSTPSSERSATVYGTAIASGRLYYTGSDGKLHVYGVPS